MAKSFQSCCCNGAAKYLASTVLNKDLLKQVSDTMKKKDAVSVPISVMYTGGTIRPIKDGKIDKVDAIGFHSGKVVAVGSESEVTSKMNSLGGTYEKIELSDGQTLLPGLIEPHVHVVGAALFKSWNDFGPFEGQNLRTGYDKGWLNDKIKEAKEKLELNGAWILGYSVDPSLMPFKPPDRDGELYKLTTFTCDDLDAMEPNIPLMMVSASGHTIYVNTSALQEIYCNAKHSEKLKDYVKKYDYFYKFRADVINTGGLQETTGLMLAFDAIPQLQKVKAFKNLDKNLDSVFETANERGITLMYDAAMDEQFLEILEKYLSNKIDVNQVRVRIGYAPLYPFDMRLDEIKKNLDQYPKPPDIPYVLYQGSVKLISDGSNQGLTGYQNEPYLCEPEGNTGKYNYEDSPSSLCKVVSTIADKGWPLMIHANGDAAIDCTIAAYKEALGGASGLEKRHRIEHCSILDGDHLKEMCDVGLSPSFTIGHVGYWGYVFKTAIFGETAEQLDICRSALDQNMRITFNSDYFVTPLGPLRMMEQAITRIMEEEWRLDDDDCTETNVLNESEKITAAQALCAVTYDAAWQCHADQWVGSLEEGKLADYVILEKDPITADPEGMRNIPVLETWVGGVKMY